MISTKDAKAFLSKNNENKISKKDIKSLQEIFSKAPLVLNEGELTGELVYISYEDYDKLTNNYYKKVMMDGVTSYFDPNYESNDNSIISITPKSLNDAIFFQDIIPTVLYLDEKNIFNLIVKKKINININDLVLSFETVDKITEKVSRFVKKIRKDIEFMSSQETYEENEKKEYENFIEELMIYSSKTPMLGKRRHHDVKYLKKLLEERNKIGNYHLHRIYVTEDELSKIIKKML